MRWKSSQLQHRQRVDPRTAGEPAASRRIGSEGERAQVSDGLEAGASGILRPRNARLGRGGTGRVRRSAADVDEARRDLAARATTPASWSSRSPRLRPPPASRREALSRPGTAAPGPGVEPDAHRPGGPQARHAAGRRPGRRRPREPVHAAGRRPVVRLALRTCTVPAKPRWLLSIPDAISQLEQLDRTLLTRRDVERLFGVSKARAATLMQTFGPSSSATRGRSRGRSSCSSSRRHAPGRVPRRGGETRAPGRRAPAGPADRGPVQGAGRDPEREAGKPARGGVRLLAADRSRCGSSGRRTPGAALRAGAGARERLRAGSRSSSVVESAGERWWRK